MHTGKTCKHAHAVSLYLDEKSPLDEYQREITDDTDEEIDSMLIGE
jgi:hypothetical protein